MPTQILAGDHSGVRHSLQAIKTTGTTEPFAVVAAMEATPSTICSRRVDSFARTAV
jgi:hypothetical protein